MYGLGKYNSVLAQILEGKTSSAHGSNFQCLGLMARGGSVDVSHSYVAGLKDLCKAAEIGLVSKPNGGKRRSHIIKLLVKHIASRIFKRVTYMLR